MKNILILFCILAFAPAVFAGGTMIYTTPQDATGHNDWYGKVIQIITVKIPTFKQ